MRGCSSEVERQLPKLNVVGSIPIARSSLFTRENKGLAEKECPEVSLDFSSCAHSGPKSPELSKAKPLSGMLETPLTKTAVLGKDQKNAAAGAKRTEVDQALLAARHDVRLGKSPKLTKVKGLGDLTKHADLLTEPRGI